MDDNQSPKRGRPPVDASDRSVQLDTTIPAKRWAELTEQAKKERLPNAHALIRRLLGVKAE